MAIIWDDGFFTELDDNRILVITGRLSSGKTLLATELAERKLKKGYKLLSQFRCIWNDEYKDVLPDEHGKYHAVAIVDEGGLYFRSAKSASAVSSFAAKLDTYIIFSGRKLPHDDLCSLTCQVWFDFFKYFLIPVKVWRYDVANGKKTYSGYFVQTSWWHYWGVYDTLDPAGAPDQMVSWFKEATRIYFEHYGREYKIYDVETGGRDDQSEFNNEFTGAVRSLSDAAQTIRKFKTIGRG